MTRLAMRQKFIEEPRTRARADVDSLETLLAFDEFEYLALFLWIAVAGPGLLSLDHPTTRRQPATEARGGSKC